jgi:hypothetical protein
VTYTMAQNLIALNGEPSRRQRGCGQRLACTGADVLYAHVNAVGLYEVS